MYLTYCIMREETMFYCKECKGYYRGFAFLHGWFLVVAVDNRKGTTEKI